MGSSDAVRADRHAKTWCAREQSVIWISGASAPPVDDRIVVASGDAVLAGGRTVQVASRAGLTARPSRTAASGFKDHRIALRPACASRCNGITSVPNIRSWCAALPRSPLTRPQAMLSKNEPTYTDRRHSAARQSGKHRAWPNRGARWQVSRRRRGHWPRECFLAKAGE
jgi:hypothetical protein